MLFRIRHRLPCFASSLQLRLRLAVCVLSLPTLCLLAYTFFASTAYADGPPVKERSRQHSGKRPSRGAQGGDLPSTDKSSARANTSERQGRSSEASRSAKRGDDGTSSLDSATTPRNDSELKTTRSVDRMNPEQQANVQQLQADLQVLAQGAQGADDEIRALAEDLQAMSPHKPDPALVEDLASDLATAVADGSLSPREMAELAAAVEEVLQSAGLSSADVAVLIHDVEAILEAADVGQAEIQAVAHDLQAIAGSIQAPTGGSKTSSSSSKKRRGRGRS